MFNVVAVRVPNSGYEFDVTVGATMTLELLERLGFRVEIVPEKSDLSEDEVMVPAILDRENIKLELGRAQLAILKMIDEGDFVQAASLAEHLAHRLKVLAADAAANEAGNLAMD
jgi:hypothetical protein